MLFEKRHNQNLKEYLSKEALLDLLLRGKSLEEVTFKNFIFDQSQTTKTVRNCELALFFAAGCLFLIPFISVMDGKFLGANSLLFVFSGFFPLAGLYLLSNIRKEKSLRSYRSSVSNPEIFDRLVIYWEALRLSNFPILARKSGGIFDIGRIYSADAGALVLFGNSPDDWKAIRRKIVPNCPLLFPSPTVLGLKFDEPDTEKTETYLASEIEKPHSKPASERTEESIRLELNRLKVKVRDSSDLRKLLSAGHIELFNAIASITQLKASNHSEAKEDVVLRVIACIEHSIEKNRKTWPGGFSFTKPDGRELNISGNLYEKICRGKSSIDKWLKWTELV